MNRMLHLDWPVANVARIGLDLPDSRQNLLRPELIEQLSEVLLDLRKHTSLKALLIASLKPDSFIAGADVGPLQKLDSVEEGRLLSERGKEVLCQLQTLGVPVIALIAGSCLGGGLELALACSVRILADQPSTRLGLPEVQLGLLPGLGGTQALPRLIGLAPALDLLLTGRQVSAKQALSLGLVDDLVAPAQLLQAGLQWIDRKPRTARLWLDRFEQYRRLVFNRSRDQVEQKTQGHYPAPQAIIEVVERSYQDKFEGQELESEYFGRLLVSAVARNLIRLFQAASLARKLPATEQALPVQELTVIGAGLMGTGISWVSLDKTQARVRVLDPNPQAAGNARLFCRRLLARRVQQRRLRPIEVEVCLARLTSTTEAQGLGQTDLLIEAVFEDKALKQQLLSQLEPQLPEQAIIASNTSALSVTELATVLRHPQRFIGMHYFSPVEKMPLVELVVGEQTSDLAIQTALAFARQQGKTPILVRDSPGFYTTRILAAYLHEVGELLQEGAPIDWLDQALVEQGFPIGPCALLDEIGLEVASHILPQMSQAFGKDFQSELRLKALLKAGRKGRKTGAGFYRYRQSGSKVDRAAYRLLKLTPSYRREELPSWTRRCLLRMVNEALRCWDESLLFNESDLDLGAVLGLGFPPFLGGPAQFARQDRTALPDLELLHEVLGVRFKPAAIWYQWAPAQGEN